MHQDPEYLSPFQAFNIQRYATNEFFNHGVAVPTIGETKFAVWLTKGRIQRDHDKKRFDIRMSEYQEEFAEYQRLWRLSSSRRQHAHNQPPTSVTPGIDEGYGIYHQEGDINTEDADDVDSDGEEVLGASKASLASQCRGLLDDDEVLEEVESCTFVLKLLCSDIWSRTITITLL